MRDLPVTPGAEPLVECLFEHGVRHIFGMPGSHSTAIYDAIYRHRKISTVLVRNEQAGAFAADGYARVTGRPGVICTTAGPGATNALTGIAEAWSDSVPVLLLTGQVDSDRMHLECGAYHEIDLEALFRPITKWCATVRAVEQIPTMVQQAFTAMTTGRPRPTALILPQDIMSGKYLGERRQGQKRADSSKGGEVEEWKDGRIEQGDQANAIEAAAQLLAGAERPIILAGGGALWSGAAGEVRALAERLNAPVITTLNAKGLLDERDAYSLGHARSVRAKMVLPQADAMLAIGCRFTQVSTELWRMAVPANLVQIDIDPEQIGMNYPVAVGIVGDAKTALSELLRALATPSGRTDGWRQTWEQARAARPAKPEWLIETLRAEMPAETRVFADACEMGLRLQTDWTSYGPLSFFYPSTYISLGWAFPAAIGAAVALPDTPIVSVSGDGGFLMTAQELATAGRYRLRVIAIVHNDSAYGSIKNIQKGKHEGRFIDVELNNPDFVQLAAAYGVPAFRASNAADLSNALRSSLSQSGPALIEVPDTWRSLRS